MHSCMRPAERRYAVDLPVCAPAVMRRVPLTLTARPNRSRQQL
jgi:hypothetical protein